MHLSYQLIGHWLIIGASGGGKSKKSAAAIYFLRMGAGKIAEETRFNRFGPVTLPSTSLGARIT
ncbi:hypothetical protein HMPREF9374_1711 [Desmospora sp. 8437]|nr:hypothetical protein HMPREF9374_1711 [Desmospora sp. 8437]